MNKAQVGAIVAAVVAVGGIVTYRLDDGSVYEVADPTDCITPPARRLPPPCLPDGGFNLKQSDYLDAGCLAQVCPRLAEIRSSGKSDFFARPADVKAKGVQTKAPDVPVEAVPVEVAPAEEVKP